MRGRPASAANGGAMVAVVLPKALPPRNRLNLRHKRLLRPRERRKRIADGVDAKSVARDRAHRLLPRHSRRRRLQLRRHRLNPPQRLRDLPRRSATKKIAPAVADVVAATMTVPLPARRHPLNKRNRLRRRRRLLLRCNRPSRRQPHRPPQRPPTTLIGVAVALNASAAVPVRRPRRSRLNLLAHRRRSLRPALRHRDTSAFHNSRRRVRPFSPRRRVSLDHRPVSVRLQHRAPPPAASSSAEVAAPSTRSSAAAVSASRMAVAARSPKSRATARSCRRRALRP